MALFQEELGRRTLEHGKEGWGEKWPGKKELIAGAVFKYLSK